MSGRESARRRVYGGTAVLAFTGLVAGLVFSSVAPAEAAAKTYKTQLSLTGLANEDNPTGGSQVGIHPGDKVTLSAASAPTAGLDKLGLGALGNTVDGLLGGTANFQVKADLSKLPGGKKDTVLDAKAKKTFTFAKVGTYNFTWTAQRVTLLGIVPINLDGNQLEKAKVKLNANNQYVGQIVVAKNPPKGGIGIQVPKVETQPEVGGVKLPKVTVPGVTTPKVTLPDVGNLAPNLPSTGKSTAPTNKPSSSAPKFQPYQLGGPTVPEQIVPKGDGGSYTGTGGYFSDSDFAGLLPTTGGSGDSVQAKNVSSNDSGSSSAAAPTAGKQPQTVELAAEPGTPTGQLPVILAIVAIIALALVAGTYARLFLLKKH